MTQTEAELSRNERIKEASAYLLGTDRKYDIIHLDPPELHTAGVVNLYTEEFYELCKARLKPGGIMSHWFNSTKITDEEQRIVVGTFMKVFPHGTVWQGPGLYSWNLIATDKPLRVPIKAVAGRLSEPAVAKNDIMHGAGGDEHETRHAGRA